MFLGGGCAASGQRLPVGTSKDPVIELLQCPSFEQSCNSPRSLLRPNPRFKGFHTTL